jgi:hypothetical protein
MKIDVYKIPIWNKYRIILNDDSLLEFEEKDLQDVINLLEKAIEDLKKEL